MTDCQMILDYSVLYDIQLWYYWLSTYPVIKSIVWTQNKYMCIPYDDTIDITFWKLGFQ